MKLNYRASTVRPDGLMLKDGPAGAKNTTPRSERRKLARAYAAKAVRKARAPKETE